MNIIRRMFSFLGGIFIISLGIVLTMKANIGYAPWDAFQKGIADSIGITIGTSSILVSLVVAGIVVLLGEKLGFGTIINIFAVGIFIDLLFPLKLIPVMQSFVPGLIMLIAGLFLCAIGTYFYISAAFGAGPRDSLMVALERKTHIPVGLSRGIIEGTVCLSGWLLGGPIGFGTLISALGISVCVQIVFSIVKFDATAVKHETFDQTWRQLKDLASTK